nr:uncharacterized protein LOC112794760 [Arachis hypogaea]
MQSLVAKIQSASPNVLYDMNGDSPQGKTYNNDHCIPEQVNYKKSSFRSPNDIPYSQNSNQGRRNHPNHGWREQPQRQQPNYATSINLMPLSLMRKLQIDEVKPTHICLQFADRFIKYPFRVVDDLSVKVGSFIFPADFVILDMEEDKNASNILGRSFLATGRPLIDVQKGEATLRVNEDEIVLNVLEALQHPNDAEGCMRIDIIEPLVEEVFEDEMLEDALDSSPEDILLEIDELAPQREKLCMPSAKEGPPKLKLKSLPPSLKYAFLGDKDTYPVLKCSRGGTHSSVQESRNSSWIDH